MNLHREVPEIKAHLVSGTKKIPVSARYESKFSVSVRFSTESREELTEFSKFVIPVNGESIELGPCRLIPDHTNDGYMGRLVFVEDVYDLENLLFEHKLVKLRNVFLNLPLILAHKDNIRQSFKNYTAGLTYDLSVYKNIFDSIDAEYEQEPEDVKHTVQKAIINSEGARLQRYLDEQLRELESLVSGFSKEEHGRHGFYFRKQLWNFILCSPLMARTNLKPRGYSGDSEMMAMIYSNDYRGNTTFSKVLNKHALEHPAAEAVRNRKQVVSRRVHEIWNNCNLGAKEKLKILSVASGPAAEMQDILLSPVDCEKYHFTLLDQDPHALSEASVLLGQIESKLRSRITTDYLRASVRTMIAGHQLKSKWGEFHCIYSMGLFDYLTPPVARAILARLYQLLKPGGELIIGNFHVSNPSRYYMEYWCDWVLYYRTEQEFLDLVLEDPSADADLFYEDTGTQMFLHIKKKELPHSNASR